MPLSKEGKVAFVQTLETLSTVFHMGNDQCQSSHESHRRAELNGIDPKETMEQRISGIAIIK
jgi:hypothetical protein